MANLCITKNGINPTIVGLSTARLTTPSLVVTHGSTTCYGALTTDANQATAPNKITVTYSGTTYYTRAPSKGMKFVDFITPYTDAVVTGTTNVACCGGSFLSGSNPEVGSGAAFKKIGYGAYAPSGCCISEYQKNMYALLQTEKYDDDTDDYPIIDEIAVFTDQPHTHDQSLLFDDRYTFTNQTLCPSYYGVKVYCNYQAMPNRFWVGCICSNGKTTSNFFRIGLLNQLDRPTYVAGAGYGCNTGDIYAGNTGECWSNRCIINNYYGNIGPAETNGAITFWKTFGVGSHTTHFHSTFGGDIDLSSTPAYRCFSRLNMQLWCCPIPSIDNLPKGTILFTSSPKECFDTTKWKHYKFRSSLFTDGAAVDNTDLYAPDDLDILNAFDRTKGMITVMCSAPNYQGDLGYRSFNNTIEIELSSKVCSNPPKYYESVALPYHHDHVNTNRLAYVCLQSCGLAGMDKFTQLPYAIIRQ